MALTIDLKPGEKLQIGDATIVLVQKSGQLARLEVEADRSIPVKKVAREAPGIRLIAEKGIMTA
jgi:hypothetical protein